MFSCFFLGFSGKRQAIRAVLAKEEMWPHIVHIVREWLGSIQLPLHVILEQGKELIDFQTH